MKTSGTHIYTIYTCICICVIYICSHFFTYIYSQETNSPQSIGLFASRYKCEVLTRDIIFGTLDNIEMVKA
jgi:hypothetical protein